MNESQASSSLLSQSLVKRIGGSGGAGSGQAYDPEAQRVHLMYQEIIQSEIERECNVMKGCMEKVKTNYVKNNQQLGALKDENRLLKI
jgi:hypothetical protein